MSTTREVWLNDAVALLSTHFHAVTDKYAPDNIRVSCGWPSVHALSRKKRRIGECWGEEASKDKQFEIFISPLLSEPLEVLSTLAHEMVHATVGLAAKHGAAFSQFGKRIGLEGKPSSMSASEDMKNAVLAPIVSKLGEYPHGSLDLAQGPAKKQTTRMHKVECGGCGYTARVSTKWLDDVGPPICPCNNEPMGAG